MKKQWFISKIFRAARAHLLRISEENNGSVDGGRCGWKWLLYWGKMRFALTIFVKKLGWYIKNFRAARAHLLRNSLEAQVSLI